MGVNLVFIGSGVPNFALSSFSLVAANVSWAPAGAGLTVVAGILAAILLSAAFSLATDRGSLRWTGNATVTSQLPFMLGIPLVIVNAVLLIWGPSPRVPEDVLPTGTSTLAAALLQHEDLALIVTVAVVVAVADWFIYRMPAGLTIRAGAEHPAYAQYVGINVSRLRSQVWLVSGAVAGIVGGLISTRLNPVPTVADSCLIPLYTRRCA